jgi:hypothetical protein
MRKWEVTYRLPTTGAKYHKTIVEATSQMYANKVFEAQYPTAKRCGNARPL